MSEAGPEAPGRPARGCQAADGSDDDAKESTPMVYKLRCVLALGIYVCGACTPAPIDSTEAPASRPPLETVTSLPTPHPGGTGPATSTATSSETAQTDCPRTHLPIDGRCLSYEEWLASRPRTMEAYGFEQDPSAQPELPPTFSLCLSVWPGMGLPLATIEGQPTIASRPAPEPPFSSEENLRRVACTQANGSDLQCQEDSPLHDFACESVHRSIGVYSDIGPVRGLVASCGYSPPDWDEPPEDYLYRMGAASRHDVAHFFLVDGVLRLIKEPAQLKKLFAPIKSAAEAINYAQLATGLVASYRLAPRPEYLYFYDPIDATRAEPTAEGYRLFLFHFQSCACEPWVNSEVELLVERDGTITWVGARPWSMTIGFSCAD